MSNVFLELLVLTILSVSHLVAFIRVVVCICAGRAKKHVMKMSSSSPPRSGNRQSNTVAMEFVSQRPRFSKISNQSLGYHFQGTMSICEPP